MEVSNRLRGGLDVVEMSGPATADGYADLRKTFCSAVEQGRIRFILNLSRATSLDSMTIGEMVACFKRARERGGDVRLVISPDGIVHELIQLTGLDQVFQIYGDESEAVAAFAAGPS